MKIVQRKINVKFKQIHFAEIYLKKHWTQWIFHIRFCDCKMNARNFIDAILFDES